MSTNLNNDLPSKFPELIDPLIAETYMSNWRSEVASGRDLIKNFQLESTDQQIRWCVGQFLPLSALQLVAGSISTTRISIRFGLKNDVLEPGEVNFKFLVRGFDESGNATSGIYELVGLRTLPTKDLNKSGQPFFQPNDYNFTAGNSMGLLPAQIANFVYENWLFNALYRGSIPANAFTVSPNVPLEGVTINVRELRNSLLIRGVQEILDINFMFCSRSISGAQRQPLNTPSGQVRPIAPSSFDIFVVSNGLIQGLKKPVEPQEKAHGFEKDKKQGDTQSAVSPPLKAPFINLGAGPGAQNIFGNGNNVAISDGFDIIAPCPSTCN